MLTIAYYFLQVMLCSGLMMAYYWVVLRNKRFHQYNRFYLLAIALLSWIVPLIKIRWGHPVASQDPQLMQFLSIVANNNSRIDKNLMQKGFEWNWHMAATGIYLLVAAFLLLAMLRALFRLYRLLQVHSCNNVGDVYLIITKAKGTPFSFFRYIFWNEEIDMHSEAGKQILQHELTHVRQKHSFDKLFIQVMLVAGWFNPFFWLLRKEMEMIHEFIADKKAVANGDTASLAQMLLTAAYPQQRFALTHPFFFSPVKRRLQMFAINQHPRFSYIRRLTVLPLLAVVVVLFAFRNKEQGANDTLSVASVIESGLTTYNNGVEKWKDASYQDPVTNTSEVLADTVIINKKEDELIIKTPGSTASTGLNKVLVIIDGKKTDNSVLQLLDPNSIQSVNVLKNESATALYGEEGKNGVVLITTKKNAEIRAVSVLVHDTIAHFNGRFSVPKGIITGGTSNNGITRKYPDSLVWDKSLGNQPLIMIDGVKDMLASVKPSDINHINVLKDNAATNKYGFEGKNGVIEVFTKTYTQANAENRAAEIKNIRREDQDKDLPLTGIFSNEFVPISFPGGETGWTKYLQRNLSVEFLKAKEAPPGIYTVVVEFVVDEYGNISGLHAGNDPGYGCAAAAVNLIKKGPKWIPASEDKHPVTAKTKRTIIFNLPGTTAKPDQAKYELN